MIRVDEWFADLLTEINDIQDIIKDIADGRRSYHEFPKHRLDTAERDVMRFISVLEQQSPPPYELIDALTDAYVAIRALKSFPKSWGKRVDDVLGALPRAILRRFDYAEDYIVKGTDTLRSIAAEQLGDASLWYVIAQLNGLDLADEESESWVGRKILVPKRDALPPKAKQHNFVIDYLEGERVLGRNIYVHAKDGMAAQDGCLRTVEGKENLAQALALRLITESGEAPLAPAFGSFLPTLVGYKREGMWESLLKAEVTRTCKADPRVRDVHSITITIEGDHVSVEFIVSPVAAEPYRLGVTL